MSNPCNVMILGGNGFMGRNLTVHLVHRGYHVTVFDAVLPETAVDGVEYLTGDFFEPASIDRLVADQQVIIHALSTIQPGNSNERRMEGYSLDFLQTVRLLNRACEENIRVLYLSSAGTVYGSYDGTPFSEDHVLRPRNHYGSEKVCVETVMGVMNIQQGGNLFSCRITNPYGPGQDYRRGVGFIDAVIRHCLSDTELEIWGDGSVVRDYIHIGDVCEALERIIRYDGPYRIFNIGTGVGSSQLEVLKIFEENGWHPDVNFLPARGVDEKISIVDNTRAKEELGMEFRSLRCGIEEYLSMLHG